MGRRKSLKAIHKEYRKRSLVYPGDLKKEYEKHQYEDLWYPELEEDIWLGRVTANKPEDILNLPNYRKYIADKPALLQLRSEKLGVPYYEPVSTITPKQQELQDLYTEQLIKSGAIERILGEMGQPFPLKSQLNDVMKQLLTEYQEPPTSQFSEYVDRTFSPGILSGAYGPEIIGGLKSGATSAFGGIQRGAQGALGALRSLISGSGTQAQSADGGISDLLSSGLRKDNTNV